MVPLRWNMKVGDPQMSVSANVSRRIDAPTEVVWGVVNDFPNIAAWSAGIQSSYTSGADGAETGLGAERRCELGGGKILDERISDYIEGSSMTIHVYGVKGLPVKSSLVTFSVRPAADGGTEAVIDAELTPKLPGFVVSLAKGVLSKQVAKQFGGLLDEWATESEKRAAAVG